MIANNELETEVPALVAKASGTVLEIGPGSGTQLSRYDKAQVTKIYGIEPNVDLHDALRKSVKENGLSDVYTIVPCAIEDAAMLRGYGIEEESGFGFMSAGIVFGAETGGDGQGVV